MIRLALVAAVAIVAGWLSASACADDVADAKKALEAQGALLPKEQR